MIIMIEYKDMIEIYLFDWHDVMTITTATLDAFVENLFAF
jgi:hypothetical protein